MSRARVRCAHAGARTDDDDWKPTVSVQCDSSHANALKKKTIAGYVGFAHPKGKPHLKSVIFYRTFLQKMQSLSSTEGELCSITEACKAAMKTILTNMEIGMDLRPLNIDNDSSAGIKLSMFHHNGKRVRHMMNRHHFRSRSINGR